MPSIVSLNSGSALLFYFSFRCAILDTSPPSPHTVPLPRRCSPLAASSTGQSGGERTRRVGLCWGGVGEDCPGKEWFHPAPPPSP